MQLTYLLSIIICCIIFIALQGSWKINAAEKEVWAESRFLQHPFVKKIRRFFHYQPVNLLLQIILALIVTRLIVYTGETAYRLIQPNAPVWDFKWFYTASKVIQAHLSPYKLDIFIDYCYKYTGLKTSNAPFVYPPNILPIIWPLGYFSISGASTIWVVFHLVSIVFILWGASILLDSKSKSFQIICTIFCASIYGIIFDLRIGNVSTLVTAFLIWTVIYARKGKNVLSGVLLGLSTIKPTLSILFILYFILKKRFSIVFLCILTSLTFTAIGLLIIHSSLTDYLHDFSQISAIFFNQFPNNPHFSASRIDSIVIAYRLFPGQESIAKLLSYVIIGILVLIAIIHLYKWQAINRWSSTIYLSEIALISCLGTAITYSQQIGSTVLVFAVVFLLNYLLWEIKSNKFSWAKMSLWLAGTVCIIMQSGLIYYRLLERFHPAWKRGDLPYVFKITLGSLPNYTLLGITIIILVLADIHWENSRNKQLENVD